MNKPQSPRVLCTVPWLPDEAIAVLEAGVNLDYRPNLPRAEVLACIGDYDAWWVHFDTPCDAEILARAERLRVICTATTGTDHIDKTTARERGIRVLSIAEDRGLLDSFTATAELAWMLLLGLMRHLRPALAAAHAGDWAEGAARFEGRQLSGRTLGVLGVGRLGTMTARYAHAFGMRVLGCDHEPITLDHVEPVDFPTLLERADAISVHIHLTPENEGLFNRETFTRMKPGSVLVNTSRGAIVDEAAAIEALASGQLGGYATDVVSDEWREDMAAHPLIQFAAEHDNVILTPHIGGATIDSVVASRTFVAGKLTHFLQHERELTWPRGVEQPIERS